jgi:hypothetical protein
MQLTSKRLKAIIYSITVIAFVLCLPTNSIAQPPANDRSISVWQYRHVPDDKVDEFIKRETTYWSKVAEKGVKDKKLSFWALLQKVGGYDLPNNSNFLFINTLPNIDKIGEVWSNVEATAGVKMAAMETGSMSTVTSTFFLHDMNWVQDAKAVPEKDFNYVVMNYQNTNFRDSMINLEKNLWMPFIKKAMDSDQSPQMGWGNAIVLAPQGDNIKFTTVSYDLYKSLQDALYAEWGKGVVLPANLFDLIGKIQMNRPGISVYRIVKVVSMPN